MNVLVIIGSPREGNSFKVAQKVEKYMNDDFEYLNLNETNLKMCTGCNACLQYGASKCPLKDDRNMVLDKMNDADAIIFVSPVYVMNVSGLFKNYIDRLCYICHRPRYFDKKAMVITTAGAIGVSSVLKYMHLIASVWGFNTVTKLGVVTAPDMEYEDWNRLEPAIRMAAHRFKKQKLVEPRLSSVIQFHAQRAVFIDKKAKRVMPRDHEHYLRLIDRKYYIKTRISWYKSVVARIVARFMLMW